MGFLFEHELLLFKSLDVATELMVLGLDAAELGLGLIVSPLFFHVLFVKLLSLF